MCLVALIIPTVDEKRSTTLFLKCLWTKNFFAHFGSSLCVNSEMAREIGWQETKIRFFAVESTQNDHNRVAEDWELVGRGSGPYDVTKCAECLSLWSLSSVWAMKLTFSLLILIYNESYRRLRKTLRFSSKRFRRCAVFGFVVRG